MALREKLKIDAVRGEGLVEAIKRKGLKPPKFKAVPKHVAIVMDGNGRWANQRGLTRIEGHRAGEAALMDVVAGAIEAGVAEVSVFAFSTENWKRSPEEVKFLMGFNREVLRTRRDQLHNWGVRVRWVGRKPKLWSSVIEELQEAETLTRNNRVLTLNMCVNYGGRIDLVDRINELTLEIEAGSRSAGVLTERSLSKLLAPTRDVDLFIRTSGERRISNFLLWQSAYAEFVFSDVLWPDYDRVELWRAISDFGSRSRRFGAAVDKPKRTAGQ